MSIFRNKQFKNRNSKLSPDSLLITFKVVDCGGRGGGGVAYRENISTLVNRVTFLDSARAGHCTCKNIHLL